VNLKDLLPGVPNAGFPLLPEHKPLYHALCTLAGNSAFLLWRKVGDEFENTLGLPRELLQPFLHQTVSNSARAENFTGPVAREDWPTVRAHLQQLRSQPELLSGYRDFLNLARGSGHSFPEALP
jgi:predicted short-subunit dehydrogenase-like oxidoreductase (DUF2520 family)